MSGNDKHKHLEFLQAAINRMAGNLFLLKGWTVTLIAALFAIAAKDANIVFFAVAFVPLFIFWGLDAFFLAQERRFRALYDDVRKRDEEDVDFSMNTAPYQEQHPWHSALWSPTLRWYYLSLAVLMVCIASIVERREADKETIQRPASTAPAASAGKR